jgi:hypothetical protein
MKIKRSELIQLANKYIGNDSSEAQNQVILKIATARCARISYETLGDNPKIDYEADIKLHDMLLESKHFSPFEHCARAMSDEEYWYYTNQHGKGLAGISDSNTHINQGWCRNFKGFIQYRHLIDEK